MFGDLKFSKFGFVLRAEGDLILPPYKGSTLRGSFGHAFKKIACPFKKQSCSDCLLSEKCIYLYVFETLSPKDTEILRKYPYVPHPFIIEPPLDERRKIPQGENISFHLILLGKSIDYLPYFIYAFEEQGKRGIGKGRGLYSLEKVVAEYFSEGDNKDMIYDGRSKKLFNKSSVIDEGVILSEAEKISGSEEILIIFLTPTRLKFGGHLTKNLQFHIFMRNLLRRLYTLLYFHCGLRDKWDFLGLIRKAEGIELVYSDIYWVDWERFSSRQNLKMKMGGFKGEGGSGVNSVIFFPYLVLGEFLHIGKGATFGLGKYKLKAM